MSYTESLPSQNSTPLEIAAGMTTHTVVHKKGLKETHKAKKKNTKDDKVPRTTAVIKQMSKTPDKSGRIVAGARPNNSKGVKMTSHLADTHKGKKETHMAKKRNTKDDKVPRTTAVIKQMSKTPDSNGNIVASIEQKLDKALSAGGQGSGRHAGSGSTFSQNAHKLGIKAYNKSNEHFGNYVKSRDSQDDVSAQHYNKASKSYGNAQDSYKEAKNLFDKGKTEEGQSAMKEAKSHERIAETHLRKVSKK